MSRYTDFIPTDWLAPDGTPWTFWLRHKLGTPDSMLVPGQELTLYGVRGCTYHGCTVGLPQFVVPGHGLQPPLTQEQAAACGIIRLSEAQVWAGGLKEARR